MSPIRALEREDLPQVGALYESVVRSGSRTPATGLLDQFERTVLDHPWADPDIPSLVFEEAGRIVGFIGSHPRRLRFESREVRLACSGQLVADPRARAPGVGALLLRSYLNGPQDITITDGANDVVKAMWEALGGRTWASASLGWTRVLRPAAWGAALLRNRAVATPPRLAVDAADRVVRGLAGSRLTPSPASATTEPLAAAALVEAVDGLPDSYQLRPAYDRSFADWLLREAAGVSSRGELVARRVPGSGWYVAYMPPGGVAQVLQVGATSAEAGAVLDQLVADAEGRGCAALRGRLEPALMEAVVQRRWLIRRSDWALVSSARPELLEAIAYGAALLTRLDGEWWMGHHLQARTAT